MKIMSDIENLVSEWCLELENVFAGNQNELDEVMALIKNNEQIAAFNYVDKFIDKNKIETTDKYKDLTTDLYLSLK